MDDPNITMEEYIRLEEEKARRNGKVYNWETATYGRIWDDDEVHNLRSVETEFPGIVFDDTFTSQAALSCEPTVSSLNNNEIDFRISFDESDDEDYTVIFDKNSFSYKIISVDNLKTDSENDNDKVNMPSLPSPEPTVKWVEMGIPFSFLTAEAIRHMALPPRDQRHQYLRFEGLEYTDADIMDFEERLGRIYSIRIHRMLVLDFESLPAIMSERFSEAFMDIDAEAEEMETAGFDLYLAESVRQIFDKGNLSAYWRGISSEGDFLGTPPSYTHIKDPILRLCHRLIACSITRRSQAPEKVTVTDLFYLRGMDVGSVNIPNLLARYLRMFASGRKRGAMIFGDLPMIDMAELVRLQICEELDDTWAWVAPGPERQQVAADGALEVSEDEPVVDEGALAVPAPIQAPQPPPAVGPSKTMAQRLESSLADLAGKENSIGVGVKYRFIWNLVCCSHAAGGDGIIMEYLVKISKKARILKLKRRVLKKLTLTSYTPLEEEKARRHALSCEPTISPLNDNEIDFIISFDDFDDEDYTPMASYFDDLDYFKDFEKEFPTIVYNDALTSKLDSLTEPTVSPQHIDEFNLKNETSLSECDEEEQNIVYFNDLFPFSIIYLDDLKSDKENDDDGIVIIQSSGDMALPPRDQRHQYLSLLAVMSKRLTSRMLMEHSDDQGQNVFSRDWRRSLRVREPPSFELIMEFFSIFRFREAIVDIDTEGTLQFQLGGVRLRMSWRQFILALELHIEEEMGTTGFGLHWAESARQISDKGDLSAYLEGGFLLNGDFMGTPPFLSSLLRIHIVAIARMERVLDRYLGLGVLPGTRMQVGTSTTTYSWTSEDYGIEVRLVLALSDRHPTYHETPSDQPEWSRFVTVVKQIVDLDKESYHKLFDILKQYQNEVNEIRAEKIARNTNPLALVAAAQQYPNDNYNHAPKPHKNQTTSSRQTSSTSSHAPTRTKGKEVAKPRTPPSLSTSEDDNDPEQAQRDKNMQKNIALINKYFTKIYKPTNNNLRTSSNSINKNVDSTPRTRNDRQTRQFGNQRTVTVAGARETVGNQEEKGVPLSAEQSDWLHETNEEPDEQELEAHYMYMERIQEVLNVIDDNSGPTYDTEPLEQNVDDNDEDERVKLANLIANLKFDIDENKNIQKQLRKANATLTHELNESKSALTESNDIRDRS
ncbi:hypothetical protein Tco_0264437 [Tanacetum coccineum]